MFFKLICVAITYPFYNKFLQIILYFIPDKQDITRLHIDDWSPKLGNGIKVDLIEQDINTLQKLAWEFIGQTIREPEELSSERYETIKKIGSKIILAINGLDEMILNTKGLSIDSVQHDMSAIKDIKDIAHNIVSLKLSDKKAISDYYSYMLEQFEQFRSGNLIDPKDALHQLKIYDNQIISSGALDLEDISLVGNVHFNFYHAMKNLVE